MLQDILAIKKELGIFTVILILALSAFFVQAQLVDLGTQSDEAISHTRFSHLQEHCIYYDGTKQCNVRRDLCNEDNTDRVTEIGLCDELSDDILEQPRVATSEPATTPQPAPEPLRIRKDPKPPIDRNNCAIKVDEGELVNIEWIGEDPDADIGPQGRLTYEFDGVVGQDGRWQTQKGDAGTYIVTGEVFDGEYYDETQLCIEVIATNEPAKVNVKSPVEVLEGEIVNIEAECYDPDGDETVMTISGWMSNPSKVTGWDDAGNYEVEVRCQDPQQEGETKAVQVTVIDRNRPPSIRWEPI